MNRPTRPKKFLISNIGFPNLQHKTLFPATDFTYLEQFPPKIAEQIEEVEWEPAQTIQDGNGAQHLCRSPRPLVVLLGPVVPNKAVFLEKEVEAPIHHTDDQGWKDVLEEGGED